ncbi:unnamed protein product, partial [marine sediment metagenome]
MGLPLVGRSRFANVYQEATRKFVAEISVGPQNYLNGQQGFEPIDPRIVLVPTESILYPLGYRRMVNKGEFKVAFKPNIEESNSIAFSVGNN